MRSGAGEYRDRVQILARMIAPSDATGEEVESWPNVTGGHWAMVESPTSGESVDANRQSFTTLTLRFRCVVPLDAVDRVRLKDTGDEYGVTGIHRERAPWGAWQTVCTLIG